MTRVLDKDESVSVVSEYDVKSTDAGIEEAEFPDHTSESSGDSSVVDHVLSVIEVIPKNKLGPKASIGQNHQGKRLKNGSDGSRTGNSEGLRSRSDGSLSRKGRLHGACTETASDMVVQNSMKMEERNEPSLLCRICHGIDQKHFFISPCDCKGSLSAVHKRCLEIWLAESNSTSCELCGFEFDTQHLPNFNIFGSVFAWVFASNHKRERQLLLCDFTSFLFLIPLAAFMSSLVVKILRQDVHKVMTGGLLVYTKVLQLIITAATLGLDVGVLSWLLLRIHYHSKHWWRWYMRNRRVVLLGYPDPREETSMQPNSSSAIREIQF